MPYPIYPIKVNEAHVKDGKGNNVTVKPDDLVELLPPIQGDTDEAYFSREHFDFMKRFLEVSGPYLISWIGLWPCGRRMLYLKIDGRGEPGAHASDFMRAKTTQEHPMKQ